MRGLARIASMASSVAISVGVRTVSGATSGFARADMVRKKMRQLTIATRARNLVSRSAVSSLASSARQPDLMTLWNTSAFRRKAYHSSFSMAMAKSPTGRFGHQLPVDRRTVRRRVDLKGLDVGEKLRTLSLLLADGRQGLDGGELHVHARRLILSDRD